MLAKIAHALLAVPLLLLAGAPVGAQLRPEEPSQSPSPGEVRENPKDSLKYVRIPPGKFMMGCSPGDRECFPNERPAHQVTISKGFWIGQTEVTVGAYKRFANQTGYSMPEAPDFNSRWRNNEQPIVNVSWGNAQAYCHWAGGRLPTEAEWEYAARAGSTEARYGPLDEVAWYIQNSLFTAREVGQKHANGWGLFDTLGNVGEWVNDWHDANYFQNSPSANPRGPRSGQARVLRGGSWFNIPQFVRVSVRFGLAPSLRGLSLGFRCVREVSAP